jgi:hypothetical protein
MLILALCALSGCGEPPEETIETAKPDVLSDTPEVEEALPSNLPSIEPEEAEEPKPAIPETVPADPPAEESLERENPDDIEWGSEINLDEMIAMAKEGSLREIQWHVMPNILRAEAVDGRIFHLRNENKGVDLRNTLIEAGVRIGKGGIIFRHVF